jgi:hypothetical protein
MMVLRKESVIVRGAEFVNLNLRAVLNLREMME